MATITLSNHEAPISATVGELLDEKRAMIALHRPPLIEEGGNPVVSSSQFIYDVRGVILISWSALR